MSRKIKINQGLDRNQNLGGSDIYRKFNTQFEHLINNPEVMWNKNKEVFEAVYIKDEDFEKQIETFRNSVMSMTKLCTGYTGIGKTTAIMHCFGLWNGDAAYSNIERKELIFPNFLDNLQAEQLEDISLSERLSAVCTKLEREYPDLKEFIVTDEGKREFFDFIEQHTGYILENVNPIEAMDMGEVELIRWKLKGAHTKFPYEFEANRLKFYIKKKYNVYRRLIILLDGIEIYPEERQIELIAKYLKLQGCMQNTDYPENGEYSVNLLIMVRPHFNRFLNMKRNLEAFAINELTIVKKKEVDLSAIFQKRFGYYSDQNIFHDESQRDSYTALMQINNNFDEKYRERILRLCFWNVRKALTSYARILANRYWVQQNKEIQGSFTIRPCEYRFDNISVFRALACDEERVFFGDHNTIIPNLLFTTEEEDLSIYCLLTLRYYYKKRGYDEYGIHAEKQIKVRREWQKILGIDVANKFLKAQEYLYDHHMIVQSLKTGYETAAHYGKEYITDESRLYISICGNELYEMLGEDSVLLEMFREDVWRDYENRDDYSKFPSSELMEQSKQEVIFLDLLEYISYLREMEEDVLSIVKNLNRIEEYNLVFGDTLIVQMLLDGVKKSIECSGKIDIVKEKLDVVNYILERTTGKIWNGWR